MPATFTFGTETFHLLPGSVEAPCLARRTLEAVTELADYPDLSFAAQLLASELVANSVRHAGSTVDQALVLTVECGAEGLHVEVRDSGRGFDVLSCLARNRSSSERHHGLFFVNALADRWGFRRTGGGFRVWFEIDLVVGRRPWHGREPIPETQAGTASAASTCARPTLTVHPSVRGDRAHFSGGF